MAKTGFTKRYFNFIGGKHSDGSALVPPPNTARTIVNVDLEPSGKISRRLGLDFEESFQSAVSGIQQSTLESSSVGMYEWFNVDQSPNATFLVIRIGLTLHIFDEGSNPLSAGLLGSVDFTSQAPQGFASAGNDIRVASGRGLLIVTGDEYEPFYVKFNPADDTFVLVPIRLIIRDFEGVDDGLGVDTRPTDLSQAHAWNLTNQGWDEQKINLFKSEQGVYPSNADILQLGFTVDSTSGLKVWKSSEIINTNLGGTPAPKGKFLLNPFLEDRLAQLDVVQQTSTTQSDNDVWFGVGGSSDPSFLQTVSTLITTTTALTAPFIGLGGTNFRPKATAFYAGRVWYASVNGRIFFSQILEADKFIGRAYQEQDPTAEDFNELVDTDGGVIVLPEAGDIKAMIPGNGGLVVLASNGIWHISGGDVGFTANNTFVNKVGSLRIQNGGAAVEAEGTIFFWADEGIYALISDEISGRPTPQSLSAARVSKDFNRIPISAKNNASASYDRVQKKVYWMYNDGLLELGSTRGPRYNMIAIFDVTLNSFYDYRIEDKLDAGDIKPFMAGMIKRSASNDFELTGTVFAGDDDVVAGTDLVATSATVLSSADHPMTIACFYPLTITATTFDFTFGEFCSRSFHDWKAAGTDFEANYISILETNPETLEEGMMDKQATWLYSYYDFRREGWGQLEYTPRFEVGKAFRVSQNVIEILRKGDPEMRATQNVIEILRKGQPDLRTTQNVIEILRNVS